MAAVKKKAPVKKPATKEPAKKPKQPPKEPESPPKEPRAYMARASQGVVNRGSGARYRCGIRFEAHEIMLADQGSPEGARVVTPAQLDEILADPEIICRELPAD